MSSLSDSPSAKSPKDKQPSETQPTAKAPYTEGLTSPGNDVSGDPTHAGKPLPQESDSTGPIYSVGQKLGPFVLEQKLGEGGMGTVWKAKQAKLNRYVALKLLPKKLLQDPQVVRRLEHETELVGRIEHENLIRAHDAGEIDGLHYLALEYLEGVDLSRLVNGDPNVAVADIVRVPSSEAPPATPPSFPYGFGIRTVADACELIRQAASGLAYAHANKLIHRDIKPSNMLLTNSGKLKILDLGLARLLPESPSKAALAATALTESGQILGTPDYMSPEQWDDTHEVDHRADLYSLGCTLFFLLCGRAPYADGIHNSMMSKMKAHGMREIPDLAQARRYALASLEQNPSPAARKLLKRLQGDEVPDDVVALYRSLLQKEREHRLSSAKEVVSILVPITKRLRAERDARRSSGGSPESARNSSSTPAAPPAGNRSSTESDDSLALQIDVAPLSLNKGSKAETEFSHWPEEDDTAQWNPEADNGPNDTSREDARTISTSGRQRSSPVSKGDRSRSRVALQLGGESRSDSPTSSSRRRLLLTAASVLAVLLLGVIVITIKHKDGTVTKIEVPDTSTVDVTRSSGGSPESSSVPKPTPDSPVAKDQDREVAEWLQSIGGWVSVFKDGRTRDIAPGTNLPEPPFALLKVSLEKLLVQQAVDNGLVLDNELGRLAGLQKLECLYLTNSSVTDSGVSRLRDLPMLRQLFLNNTQVTNACADSLLAFPKLEMLRLSKSQMTPAILTKLKSHPRLSYLEIDWPFTPSLAASLKDFPALRSLFLHESWLMTAGVAELKQMPLTSLGFQGPLTDKRLQLLLAFPQLELVEFGAIPGVTPQGLRPLAELPRLTQLTFISTRLGDEHMAVLSEFSNVETLWLWYYNNPNNPITDAGLEHLSRMPKLKELRVSKTEVTAAGVARFRAARPNVRITTDVKEPDLRSSGGSPESPSVTTPTSDKPIAKDQDREVAEWVLSVGGKVDVVKDGVTHSVHVTGKLPNSPFEIRSGNFGVVLRDPELKHFAGLQSLDTLYLGYMPVTDAGVAQLRDLPKLQSLYLNSTRVTDACADSILALPSLNSLRLAATKVTPAIVPKLKLHPNLALLEVPELPFTQELASNLKQLPKLSGLQLHESWLTSEGLSALQQMPLTTLGFRGEVTDERIKLLTALQQLKVLELVEFKGISPAGFRSLAALPRLNEIVFLRSPLSDEHMAALADLPHLTSLAINHSSKPNNPITDAGLEYLARMPKLKELNLSKTEITPAGVARFRTARPDVRLITDVKEPDLRSSGGSPESASVTKPTGEPPVATDQDRAVAEWVISMGGVVAVNQDGASRNIPLGGRLPDGSFILGGANLSEFRVSSGNSGVVLDDELRRFEGLKGLRTLQFAFSPVSDIGMARLRNLPKLSRLHLQGTKVTDACAESLLAMPMLENLRISAVNITPNIIPKLKAHPRLSFIEINHLPFTPGLAASFKQLPHLRGLLLHDSWLTAEGVAELKQMPLTTLGFRGQLSDERMQLLTNFPQVELLELGDITGVTPNGLRPLAQQRQVKRIVFFGTRLTDEHMAALAEFAHLESLAIDFYKSPNNSITDVGLEHLSRLPKLKKLDMSKTEVTAEGVRRFRAARPDIQLTTDVKVP